MCVYDAAPPLSTTLFTRLLDVITIAGSTLVNVNNAGPYAPVAPVAPVLPVDPV